MGDKGSFMNDKFLKEDRLDGHPRMVIMVGLSRTGKSTFVNRMVRQAARQGISFTIISGDDIRRSLGVRYEARLEDQVKYTMGVMAGAIMHRRHHVVIDETNLSDRDRQRWIDMAELHDYTWTIAEIEPLPEPVHREECRRHDFPWAVIEEQKRRYQPVPAAMRSHNRYTLVKKED